MKGCLAYICCTPCWTCHMAVRLAEKGGFKEGDMDAVLKTVCCCTAPCYMNSITLEYYKQKKAAAAQHNPKAEWLVTIKDQYYAACCGCLLAKDMYEHVGESGSMGCLLRCICPPVFLCCVGPKIAKLENIPDSCAVGKVLCPCTGSCYATSVVAEYFYQKKAGISANARAGPGQIEMQ